MMAGHVGYGWRGKDHVPTRVNILEPIGDRIIIEPIPAEEATRCVTIPPITRGLQRGTVIVVGPRFSSAGRFAELTGETVPSTLTPGDEVLYTRNDSPEVEAEGKKLLILRESDVLARVR